MLDTTQYCERFTSPNWWVICEECGGTLALPTLESRETPREVQLQRLWRVVACRGGCRTMRTDYRCPRCLRVIGTITVSGPSLVHLSPCGHQIAAPDEVLEMDDLHPPRPDVWVMDFLAESH